jgi:hypothetical protein
MYDMALTLDGSSFRDRSGRAIILRGLNLGGDCKVPFTPNGHTYLPSDFSDHRTVSFIGRPAPLDEIDSHLARIAHWGFNCLRLLTTWEAVEHAGPGQHDEAYLDYYAEVCRRAGQYGLRVFVDFHQDVWSRMSGGDGAPGWTFEAAGLDFTKFHASGAAHVMQYRYDHRLGGHQPDYSVMSWGGNFRRPANGIIWTFFFAGSDFAPGCRVGGYDIQHFLQDHYLGSMAAVAERVSHLDNVIGFDTLNEPGTGYIGRALDEPMTRYRGEAWSPLDGLAVASGCRRDVPILTLGGHSTDGFATMNADEVSIWLPGRQDPFREAGVWDLDDHGHPVALRPDFFQVFDGRTVGVERDYMVPFFNRVADTIRAKRSDWLVFAEIDPLSALAGKGFPAGCPDRTVNAAHWYDVAALVTKRFSVERSENIHTGVVREGRQAIEDGYVEELGQLKAAAATLNGGAGAPTLIGECGIQYDMNDAQAYEAWASGDRSTAIWGPQTTALDLMYNALDRLLLSSTQWNYTVSNRNDPMIGDGWNQEDLSVWSIDQVTDSEDPDAGGRAVHGFCRPYARAIQGTPVRQGFDSLSGHYQLELDANPAVTEPTEIYVPRLQFPSGYEITMNGEPVSVMEDSQILYFPICSGRTTISIRSLT